MSDRPAVHADHRVQHRFPRHARFCPMCGAAMTPRIVLPDRKTLPVCEKCGFVLFSGPKLVAGCLVTRGEQVMLIRRGNEPRRGMWTFPGGYVDLGETAQAAAIRETREEAGIAVETSGLLGIYSNPKDPATAIAVFLADGSNANPHPTDEAVEIKFFGREEIPWEAIAFVTTTAALRDWIASYNRLFSRTAH